MIRSRSYIGFWGLVALQFAGAQAILWSSMPVYHELVHGTKGGATMLEVIIASMAVITMQAAYWLAHFAQPQLAFRKHRIFGHLLVWVGELSFLFPTTLAAVGFFDESIELTADWWRIVLMTCMLFAMFCYKKQLQTLGEALIEGQPAEPRGAGAGT